jgi:hypothetical protein
MNITINIIADDSNKLTWPSPNPNPPIMWDLLNQSQREAPSGLVKI